ncbi:MAG: hypothetical protein ACOCV1_01560 [Bacillota bacterium]
MKNIIKTAGGKIYGNPIAGVGFIVFLRRILIFIWVATIFVSIWGAYSSGGLTNTFNYLGGEIATPTFQIHNTTGEIIEQGGVYSSTGNFFSDFWDMLKNYGSLFFALLNLFVWLRFYKLIATWVFTGDTSRVTSNWLIALAGFFLLQIIFIGYFHRELGLEGILIPFKAFWNLFKSIPYLIPGGNAL